MNWFAVGITLILFFGPIGISFFIKFFYQQMNKYQAAVMIISLIIFAIGFGMIFGYGG